MAPRGIWSYGPRMTRGRDRAVRRPLAVFRDDVLIGCTDERTGLFRRDFDLPGGEKFDDQWYSDRIRKRAKETGGDYTRTERLMRKAKWTAANVADAPIVAAALTRGKCFVIDDKGVLTVVSPADGKRLGRVKLPSSPVWDGLAVANGRLYVAAADGSVICLGK